MPSPLQGGQKSINKMEEVSASSFFFSVFFFLEMCFS